eukprot:4718966-Alexandrium_andersonii.AAC.1
MERGRAWESLSVPWNLQGQEDDPTERPDLPASGWSGQMTEASVTGRPKCSRTTRNSRQASLQP